MRAAYASYVPTGDAIYDEMMANRIPDAPEAVDAFMAKIQSFADNTNTYGDKPIRLTTYYDAAGNEVDTPVVRELDAEDMWPQLKMPAPAAAVVERHPYFEQMLFAIHDQPMLFDDAQHLILHLGAAGGICLDEDQKADERERTGVWHCLFVLPNERVRPEDEAEMKVLNDMKGFSDTPTASTFVSPEQAVLGARGEELASILEDSLRVNLTIQITEGGKLQIVDWVVFFA